MTDDYIKRSDVKKAIFGWCRGTDDRRSWYVVIDGVYAADVEPKRKTGHWIKEGDDAMCSVCDEILCGEAWEDLDPIDDIGLHYCPNCGSRMLHEPPKEEDPV